MINELRALQAQIDTLNAQGAVDLVSTSSTCSTMNRLLANAAVTFATGNTFATRAVCKQAGTFTKIRVASASAGGTTPTALIAGVWDTAGTTLLATTADFSSGYALSTLYEKPLISPLALTLGQAVHIGLASVSGSSLQFRGSAGAGQVNGVTPIIARSAGSYSGGALPSACAAAGTGSLLWAELI